MSKNIQQPAIIAPVYIPGLMTLTGPPMHLQDSPCSVAAGKSHS